MFKKKARLWTGFAAAAMLAVAATGCSAGGSSGQGTDAEGAWVGSDSEVYQLVDFAPSYAYFVQVYEGFEAAAEQLGVKAEHGGGAQLDVAVQVNAFQQMAAKSPAGIAVVPFDGEAFVGPIDEVVASGIPVVTADTDSPDSKRAAYIGSNSYEGGVAAADALAERHPDGAKIGVVTLVGATNFTTRFQGMEDRIAEAYPNLEVVEYVNGGADSNFAAASTQSLLQAHPDLDVIVAGTTQFMIGALQAVKEADRTDIEIDTFDTVEPTLDAIESGEVGFAVSQAPWSMGYWSLMQLYALKHGLVTPFPNGDEFGISPLPPVTNTGIQIVTKDNVAAFVE